MRRFFLFCMLIICFLCAGYLKGGDFSIISGDLGSRQSYVLGAVNSGEFEEVRVRNFDLQEVVKISSRNAEIVGSVEDFNLEHFKNELNLKIISCEEVAGRLVLTGFSNKIRKFVYVNGERVNVQVSLATDIVKVGSPLILGAF